MGFFSPLGIAILGISNAVGHVLTWYSRKQDREQRQQFADLRAQESKRAYADMLARDQKQAEFALERAQAESSMRIEEAHVMADIKQAMEIEGERRHRELANSPFEYSLDEAHQMVAEHTRDGAVPVFLIAPFQYDYPTDGVPVFTTAVRRTWAMDPWSSDLAVLDGLITRPLKWLDVDIRTIRRALHDLPVVAVHGHVQANARLWISVTAWNLGDASGTRVLDMNLAPLMLPAPEEDTIQRRLAFEDAAASAVSLVAGAYGDWFHILRSGRLPRMHTLLSAELDPLRRSLAADGAAMYAATVSRGLASGTRAALAQAVILAEGGLLDDAVAAARAVLGNRQLDDSELGELAVLLRRLENGPAGPRLAQEIGQLQHHILLVQPGMKGFS